MKRAWHAFSFFYLLPFLLFLAGAAWIANHYEEWMADCEAEDALKRLA